MPAAPPAKPVKKTGKKPAPSVPSPARPAAQKAPPPPGRAARRKMARTALGLALLGCGAYLGLSMVSYLLSWKEDANLFYTTQSSGDWLEQSDAVLSNIGGRLGAWLAHNLITRSAGVAAMAIALWLCNFGLRILYGARMGAVMRYLRWTAIAMLLIGPVMAYLMPHAAFPWGGAWGHQANDYLVGLLGRAGVGLALGSVALFAVISIFALDIAPILQRARAASRKMREQMASRLQGSDEPDFLEEEASGAPARPSRKKAAVPDDAAADGALPDAGDETGTAPMPPARRKPAKEYDLQLNEREGEDGDEPPFDADDDEADMADDDSDDEINEEEAAAYAAYEAQRQAARQPAALQPPARPAQSGDIADLDFEIVQAQERPAPAVAHGAHISIESGEPYAPELDLPDYRFPTLDLLPDRGSEAVALDKEELEKNKTQIIQTLRSFGIEIQRITATVGPTVTLYEVVPAEGVRISKIRNLEDDIALALAALGIRIIAPIPGRGTIGIEVPNANKQVVAMRTLLASEKFVHNKMSLPIALGKKIDNENYIVDLATMPHLLMAGATGQGKSVGINAILVSLLYKKHPSQLKFIMVDPKKVELSIYRVIEQHFLAKLPNEEEPIITDTKKVIHTLNALCIEMDNRYDLLKDAGARNIKEYNDKFIARRLNPQNGHKFLPFIVLVVDEFADLIMTAGKEVEMPIARLAQLARAVGIHLIVATQRPSVNVITGTIKANFPARVAFKVSSKIDSRTILDASGAEQLIGRGDMLVSHGSELLRLQCCFVDTPEVEEIVDFIGQQRGYATAHLLPEYEGADDDDGPKKNVDLTNRDKMFEDSARLVVATQLGSTSNIQRKFNLGYNRAGRIMDQLEAAGIVGPTNGSKPREVLFHTEYELEEFLQSLA